MKGQGGFEAITLSNFRDIPQLKEIPSEFLRDIGVVGSVLPFKSNRYVADYLIDWANIPNDPIFQLTFPQRGMLTQDQYAKIAGLIDAGASKREINAAANSIRLALNPHPAGQVEHNTPIIDGSTEMGMQHKYDETFLFFPTQGQTCYAYCTFCFRWAQFVDMDEHKFATMEAEKLKAYLKKNPQVSDVLFTGGDPMVMKASSLAAYVDGLLDPELDRIRTIRIGTKALASWPRRFTTDSDADEILRIFEKVVASGKELAIMANYNHPVELEPEEAARAVRAVRSTGAMIYTQSPVNAHINDNAECWARMWSEQARMGIVPYYLFITRDTGPQEYFKVPLVRAWEIFTAAYRSISGLARTVRGPSMPCTPGRLSVDGPVTIRGEKLLQLRFLQARDVEWVNRPFYAEYDEKACWLDELKPAFGEKRFFFEAEQEAIFAKRKTLISGA